MSIQITKSNFEQTVLQADKPVLVDFWAPWCGPCRMVGPVVEEVASQLEGSLIVGKINVDEQPDLAAQFSVMTIPTLMVFQGGKVAAKTVGAMNKQQLLDFINQAK